MKLIAFFRPNVLGVECNLDLYVGKESYVPYVELNQLLEFFQQVNKKMLNPIEPTLKELIDKLAAQTGCDKKKLVEVILNQQKENLEQRLKALEKDLTS